MDSRGQAASELLLGRCYEGAIAGDDANERRVFRRELTQDRRHGAARDAKLGREVIHRRELGVGRILSVSDPLAQDALNPRARQFRLLTPHVNDGVMIDPPCAESTDLTSYPSRTSITA